jgi:biopolymer transport protein ExbD
MGMGAGPKEINVTPLIDVLLVLLIIFIVMMPIMMRLESVEVPPKLPENSVPAEPPVVLKINADSSVTIDDTETVSGLELPGKIGDRVRIAKAVFVDFGEGVAWSEVVHTVDLLRGMSDDPRNPDAIKVAVRVHEADQ